MMRINDVYRSTEVMRWHIVKTKRKQSVAEHSYIVAMLALEIAKAMPVAEEVQFMVVKYAMFHDLSEVIFGDVPGPVKKIIDYNEVMKQHEMDVTSNYRLEAHPDVGYMVRMIVKLADLAESVKFLMLNKDSPHAETVYQKLYAELLHFWGTKFIPNMLGHHPISAAHQIWDKTVQTFLYAEDFTIDGYLHHLDMMDPDRGHGVAPDAPPLASDD